MQKIEHILDIYQKHGAQGLPLGYTGESMTVLHSGACRRA